MRTRAGGVLAAQAHRGRLRVRQHPAHHQGTALHHLRAPGVVRRRHVPADADRRGVQRGRHRAQARAGLLPQADELPDAPPDLPVAGAFLPRTSVAALRVRQRLPLREVRRGPRADPGARHDPGRRAHLHHPRADARRADLAAAVRARTAGRLRPRRLLPGTVDQGPRQVRRLRRAVGGSHRDAARSGRSLRPATGARPRAERRSTGRRSRCRCATRWDATGRCRRSSSTSTCPTASSWSTPPPTGHASARC